MTEILDRRTEMLGAVLRSAARFGGRLGPVLAWRIAKRLHRTRSNTECLYPIEARGLRWQLDLDDTLQRHIFYTGGYEHALIREVTQRIRPADTVLDVGANIGAFALPVARRLRARSGGRVLAAEPSAETFGRLTGHISLNGLDKHVMPYRLALGRARGTGALRARGHPGDDLGWRTLIGTGPTLEEVKIVRGDSWLRELGVDQVDVLKVDVEGFEAEVIDGLADYLEQRPPRVIVMEVVERHQQAAGRNAVDLIHRMREYGYTGFWVRIRGLVRMSAERRSGNAIFLRG